MMTEKQFIEMLEKIKERCRKTLCPDCPFKNPNDCQLRVIARMLNTSPINWDIKEIEEVINDRRKHC